MSVTNQLWMRAIRVGEVGTLAQLAKADNHEVVAPSHVFTKNGETIGYASVSRVPLILPWFHTQKCNARDSLYFINQIENLVAECMPPNGQDFIAVPFVAGSPFEPHIEQLGFVNAGKVNLTFKKVR